MDASEIPPKKRRTDNEGLCPDDESEIPSSSPVVVFAHGAGAPSSSDWMIRWKEMIKKTLSAVEVVTFDYPYIAGGKRKVPPKAEKLIEFHLDLVKETAAKFPGHPLILAGKSMGYRVSCMVAVNEDITVSAVICLGYPLKGTKGAIRDETLLEMGVPVMFMQGSKDPLCPLDKLQAVCSKMKAVTELHVIDGGDHSFEIGKKHLETKGLTQDQVEDIALQAIAACLQISWLLKGRSSSFYFIGWLIYCSVILDILHLPCTFLILTPNWLYGYQFISVLSTCLVSLIKQSDLFSLYFDL